MLNDICCFAGMYHYSLVYKLQSLIFIHQYGHTDLCQRVLRHLASLASAQTNPGARTQLNGQRWLTKLRGRSFAQSGFW